MINNGCCEGIEDLHEEQNESFELGHKQLNDFAHHIWHLPKCPVLQSLKKPLHGLRVNILVKPKNPFILLACN